MTTYQSEAYEEIGVISSTIIEMQEHGLLTDSREDSFDKEILKLAKKKIKYHTKFL